MEETALVDRDVFRRVMGVEVQKPPCTTLHSHNARGGRTVDFWWCRKPEASETVRVLGVGVGVAILGVPVVSELVGEY